MQEPGATVKILHTADVHLKAGNSRTVEALETVIAHASDADVDMVTIGGDLFDTPADADSLRPELRELFQDNPCEVVAIPGNHDEHVYRDNLRFGNDLRILTETPYETVDMGSVGVVGVPFTASMTEELFSALQDRERHEVDVLLLHCTLDIGFHSAEVGKSEGTYFPVSRATLAELDFDYVLAGHIHSTVREIPLANGGTFIYPGSPVSHSTTETGRRHAVAIETDDATMTTIPVDTYYYDSLTRLVRPGDEDEVLSEIREWVARRRDDRCELEVNVDGFVDRDEQAFYEQLCEAAAPVEPVDETRSATPIMEHPLYRRFVEQLEQRDDVDQEQVRTRVIEVLSQLLTQKTVKST